MASSPSLKKRAKRLLSDGDDHEESAEGEAETSSEPATPTATRRRLTRRLSTPVVIEEEEDDDEDEDFVVSATPHDDDLSDTGDEDDVDSDDDEDDADDDNDAAMEQAGGSSAAAAAPRRAPRRQPRGEGQPRGGTRTQRKRAPAFMTPELAQLWDKLDETHPLVTAVAVDPPAQLKIELLPFQREGLGWLQRQEKSNFHGGILADEMGMGKTIQMIALLLSEQSADQPTLIVCPTIALGQWKAEIARHTEPGSLNVELYYGPNRDRRLSNFQTSTIFLTTYSTIETDHRRQEYGFKRQGETVREKSPLFQVTFFRIVLDEAHSIKDRASNTARAVFQLKCERKWSLSGTPLQNRVGELYSLIRFLQVSPFSYYFCEKCDCKMLQWSFKKDHKHCDGCGHVSHQHYCWWNREVLRPIQQHGATGEGRAGFAKLSRLMPRIMLRRTKLECADDLGLPPRVVITRRDFFNEEEEDFYEALYSESKTKFVSYVQQGTLLNNYAHVFELITRMRQAADHPFLITHRVAIDGDRNVDVCGICQELPEDPIQAGCKHVFCRDDISRYLSSSISEESLECPICFKKLTIDLNQPTWEAANKTKKRQSIISRIDIDRWRSSTKIEALLEELTMLREQGDNIKSIVFSQYVNFLDLIEWRLQKAGFRCVKLDGTMSSLQRDAIINAFMTMPQITVFLISLKAGGIALNLTEASRVFLLDPWWNPAVEAQAMDRIHRLGQYRPIQVTRIVIENSIESRIIQLQEKKNLLFQSTVGMDVDALSRLTQEDLQFLFVL